MAQIAKNKEIDQFLLNWETNQQIPRWTEKNPAQKGRRKVPPGKEIGQPNKQEGNAGGNGVKKDNSPQNN